MKAVRDDKSNVPRSTQVGLLMSPNLRRNFRYDECKLIQIHFSMGLSSGGIFKSSGKTFLINSPDFC